MSNVIDKIQVSGVTYDIGGGSITIDPTLDSGSTNPVANSAITTALDEKVNVADNIVSAATINYAYDVGDTSYKYPYNKGLIINEFYVKHVNQYTYTNIAAWNYMIISNGSDYPSIKIAVDCSNYQITAVTSTSGENFTYAIEDGVLHVTLSEGYFVQTIIQNQDFQISYEKYTIESGQTADVINEDLIDVIQDIYDQVPKAYLSAVTPMLNSTYLSIQNIKSDGSNSGQFISFGSSIKGDNNKMDVYLPSRYTTNVTLNTGNGSYCQVPSSTVNDYSSAFSYMYLAVNTGYTGSSTSFTFTVKTLFSNNTVQTDTFTYDVANKTIGGNQLYISVFCYDNTISIYPKQYNFSRIQSVSEPNCKIGGVDSPFKNQYIITGVTAGSYTRQANTVINEIYSELNSKATTTYVDYSTSGKAETTAVTEAISEATSGKVDTSVYTAYTAATDSVLANKQTTLTAGTNITIVDNVISATGGGSVTVDTELDSGSTNPVQNKVIYNKIDEVEEVTAAGLNALNDKITPTVELTQAQYDALVDKDPNTYYIITDAQAVDLTNYYTKTETNTLLGGKQATLVSGTNIKTINNESILGSGNIDIQGGSTYTAGRGIDITNDTISFSLPISAGTGTGSLIIGDNGGGTSYASVASGDGAVVFPSRKFYGKNYAIAESSFAHGSGCSANTPCSHAEGYNTKCVNGFNSHSEGDSTEARGTSSHSEGEHTLAGEAYNKNACHAEGCYTSAMTSYSHAEGYYTKTTNKSEHASGRYNNSVSATTTFGDSGNTLFSVGNGTSNSTRHNAFEIRQNGDIYLTKDGQDVKLQDQLGGGGTVDQTIISGSTNAVAGGAVYNKIDEVEQVTAAGLNALNDALGGLKLVKLTQAEYNALATKDSSTLYVIVD